ncbi:hypothetical protein SMU68_09746 [Streptococcus mutans NFSM1]|nr:hypothetical protein SMU68_09746 [Streptococcus mutans NFSM1]
MQQFFFTDYYKAKKWLLHRTINDTTMTIDAKSLTLTKMQDWKAKI